jgi:hypothetical protein
MRDLKFSINYDSLLSVVDKYPDLLEESRTVFEQVRGLAAAELNGRQDAVFGPIHGDFWSGKYVLSFGIPGYPAMLYLLTTVVS